jgi:hypothetical protein
MRKMTPALCMGAITGPVRGGSQCRYLELPCTGCEGIYKAMMCWERVVGAVSKEDVETGLVSLAAPGGHLRGYCRQQPTEEGCHSR